jgi:hypothetical protein
MKDRRFRTSQLSLAESTRLRKAMYRLSLYSDIYGITAQESAHEAESDEEIELEVEEAQQLRKGFFNCFTTPELREIQRVDFFLRRMLAGVTGHSPDSQTSEHYHYHLYPTPLIISPYSRRLGSLLNLLQSF